MFPLPPERPGREADADDLGYLQLCADRRYHRLTMEAFERAAGLASDRYWIEARPGGAPSWSDTTRAARLAYRAGAMHMGWAAHGDRCYGFPGVSDAELRSRLEHAARRAAAAFPRAAHYLLFGTPAAVEVVKIADPLGVTSRP